MGHYKVSTYVKIATVLYFFKQVIVIFMKTLQ